MADGSDMGLWSYSGAVLLPSVPSLWPLAIISAMLAICISDLLWRRVANSITMSFWLLGLCFATQGGGWTGLGASLMASIVCLTIALIPYAFGLMGAADVKVFAGFGALVGPASILPLIAYAAIFAGFMGAVALWRQGSYSISRMVVACLHPQGALERARKSGQTMPLTVAFCSGAYAILWGRQIWL